MSEYWKSTPKYWCKQCSVYVRDTKLEKANHEATGKHQGNLRRFLRDIHKENEKAERDKQRAKDEIARLNGNTPAQKQASSQLPKTPVSKVSPQVATAAERRVQVMQLAAMGVAVPEQYRQDLAMAGEWQTVTEGLIAHVKQEDSKGPDTLASRSIETVIPASNNKRRVDEADLADEGVGRKFAWGSATKTLRISNDSELDSLLDGSNLMSKMEGHQEPQAHGAGVETDVEDVVAPVKLEEPDPQDSAVPRQDTDKREATSDDQVFFKKRRRKDKKT